MKDTGLFALINDTCGTSDEMTVMSVNQNQDCQVSWSSCTSACETSDQRTFTVIQSQTGTGSPCEGASDCVHGDGLCLECAPGDYLGTLDLSNIEYNNLGGQGPNGSDPPVIKYRNVATHIRGVQGPRNIHLVVSLVDGDYTATRIELNGNINSFGAINISQHLK
eukprot:UN32885